MLANAIAPKRGLTTSQLADALGIDHGPSPAGKVDWEKVDVVSGQIRQDALGAGFERAAWDDREFWNVEDDPRRRSQYFAVGNSVNFRFWSLEEGRMRPTAGTLEGTAYQGAMYMWRALRRALDASGGHLLEPGFLAEFGDRDFDRIFCDDSGRNPLDAGREDRIANLRDLGQRLASSWDDCFFNLVEESGHSLVEFARLSREFRAFDDSMLKLTMLNAILHSGSGIYEFADEPLPAIDYHLLKQAMRQGMVRPAESLERQLENSDLLDPGDAVELRRLALLALVGVAERTGLSGEVLDNRFWLNRVNCTDPSPVCLDPALAERCPFYGACQQLIQFERPLELTRYY